MAFEGNAEQRAVRESRAVSQSFSSTFLITVLAALTLHCGGDSGVTPPNEPSIELSSAGVTFSGTAGGAASGPQTVEITNRGGGTLSGLAIEISYTLDQPAGWLSGTLSHTTAPSALTLTVTPGSLPEGSYTASVSVSSGTASDSPQAVSVTFTVAPSAGGGPLIALSSNSQNFTAQQGGPNPPTQPVQVTNAGGGALNGLATSVSYTAGEPTGWLTATLSSTDAPSTLTLAAATGSLAAGTYTATVAVASPAASNSSQMVSVTFTVAPSAGGGPTIALSNTSRSFTASQGGGNPSAQTVRVTNSGGGTLNGLTATVSYTAGQPTGWLAATLSSTDAPSTLTLAATSGSLAAGTYTASVAVSSPVASNNQQTVSVTFTVASAAGGGPVIALSPTNRSFTAPQGGEDPASQTVQVTNSGGGTLNGLTATVAYTAGQPAGWLAASLSSTTAPSTLTLTATTGSLVTGTYTATVAVASPAASNSSQTVNVTLKVAPPAAGRPTIALSPSVVSFSATEGETDPAAKTVDVSNGGTGTLSGLAVGPITYGASQPTGWLSATLSGTSAPATVTLQATTTSLGAGTYTATVPISSTLPGVSPQNVEVSFDVASTGPVDGILAASYAGSSDLYVVEPRVDGRDVRRGPIETATGDHPQITDLAITPAGTLWGTSFTKMYTIDQSTGEAFEVAIQGLHNANALAFSGDAKLYGATDEGELFQVSTTYQAIMIGSFGGGLKSDGDIVFAPDGTLYGVALDQGSSVLVKIDPATGQATRVSGTPIGFGSVWGLAYFQGQLFGLTAGSGDANGELIKIDVSSGTATRVRSLRFDTGGAASARP